jgi:hypothetical protein
MGDQIPHVPADRRRRAEPHPSGGVPAGLHDSYVPRTGPAPWSVRVHCPAGGAGAAQARAGVRGARAGGVRDAAVARSVLGRYPVQPSAGRPIDFDNPPAEPPPGCVDPLLWRLSHRLHVAHAPGPDGWCQTCRPRQFHPCSSRHLADRGLRGACPPQNGFHRGTTYVPDGRGRWRPL